MPTECAHGNIIDWGGFGGDDAAPPECPDCVTPDDRISPPFTPAQVASLNTWQQWPTVHPFTCRRESNHGALIAHGDGLFCPECDYIQTWAFGFMAIPTI